MRELEATVGEKQQLGEQLSQLALKLEAAQSMWERHAEHDGGDVSSMHEVTEEVLDKVVAALTERRRSIHTLADFEVKAVDPDALAARFRVFPEETAAAIMEVRTGCFVAVGLKLQVVRKGGQGGSKLPLRGPRGPSSKGVCVI